MEATEQNLARVNDIVAELERQLASLRRQAKKAERYAKVKEELRDLDLPVATMQLLEMDVRQKVQSAQRQELEQRFEATTANVAAQETALEAERLAHLEEEQRLQVEQAATIAMFGPCAPS